ncbi:MAG TPA: hypothetical protein VHU41_10445 [Thermoanaerobaculia bacterium]|nr:hypothetical protein [Thermoanaerobaculia bacterium]
MDRRTSAHNVAAMQFLELNQIDEWCTEHGIAELNRHAPVLLTRAYGKSVTPPGQEADVAVAVVDALGEWDECLLWIEEWGVWPSSEDWPKFYAARGAHGERRSLENAPGHLFSWNERPDLIQFLQLVLENAWNAEIVQLAQPPNGKRAFVSHDEYVDVFTA